MDPNRPKPSVKQKDAEELAILSKFPQIMHEPFVEPIRIARGHGLPAIIRSPADAYIALDGRGPDSMAWTLVRSGLTWMRRGEYHDVDALRWQLASSLWLDGALIGN